MHKYFISSLTFWSLDAAKLPLYGTGLITTSELKNSHSNQDGKIKIRIRLCVEMVVNLDYRSSCQTEILNGSTDSRIPRHVSTKRDQ